MSAKGRSDCGGGLFAGILRPVKSGVFSLYFYKASLCGNEICHDFGWKNRYLYWRFQVDYWGRSPGAGAENASSVYGNYGWDWHCAGR